VIRALVCCAAALAACTTAQGRGLGDRPPPALGEPAPTVDDPKAEAAYQDVLDRYSRRAELYAGPEQGEDTRMFTAATYQSPAFREARVRRNAAFRAEPAEVVDKALAKERADAEQFDDFYLGVHLVDYHYDDFDRPGSIWRVALVGGGAEATPTRIERVGRANVTLRAIYPYLGDFWVAYRVRFPKQVQGRGAQLALRISSALGRVEMSFPAQ